MWDPWQLQPGLLQKRILMRAPAVLMYWYTLRDQEETQQEDSSFLSHFSHTFPFLFLPQSLPWRLKVKSRALRKGTGETDQYDRDPQIPVPHVEGGSRGTGVSLWRLTGLWCCSLADKLGGRERPGPQISTFLHSSGHQNYASPEEMSHLPATLPVTRDNCLHQLALFFLLNFTQMTSSFFKLCCFSMFDPENPASAEVLPIHRLRG